MSEHILYHGTAESRLEQILKEGIRPRGKGIKGNWQGWTKSKAGFVYLSSWMPAYFGAAAMKKGKSADRVVILRVAVQEEDLFPDEDWLATGFQKAKGGTLEHWQAVVKPERFQDLALECLTHYGSVATRGVPAESILDHRILSPGLKLWGALGGDVVPKPLTHQLLGETYKHRLRLLFEVGEEAVIEDEQGYWRKFLEVK